MGLNNMKLYVMYALFWAILLTGCSSQKKWVAKGVAHPEWGAQFCATQWPAKVLDSTTTIDPIKRAENVDYTRLIDSIRNEAKKGSDSPDLAKNGTVDDCRDRYEALRKRFVAVNTALSSFAMGYEKCKPDTIRIRTKITIQDRAALKTAQDSLKKSSDNLIKVTEQRDNSRSQRNILIVITLACVCLIGYKILKSLRP